MNKKIVVLVNLVRVVIYPYYKKHPLKLVLSIIGVALGVAVLVAIKGASLSAQLTMKNFITSISQRADLQISFGRNGFDENYYPKITQVNGVKTAFPLIITRTQMKTKNQQYHVLTLGMDATKRGIWSQSKGTTGFDIGKYFSLPNQVIVGEDFLKTHHIHKKSVINLVTAHGVVPFQIIHVLKKQTSPYAQANNILILDFFAAQYYFQKENRLDRVDVEVDDEFEVTQVQANLHQALHSNLKIKTVDERSNQSTNLYHSFKLNLTVVSFIAILVGMYLIYNSMNSSILQQRKEIGILRASGATRTDILLLFLLKGGIIGFIASLIGIGLGIVLSYYSVGAFTQKISRQYLTSHTEFVFWEPSIIILGLVIGIGMTLVASFIPALSAVKITPVETMRSISYETTQQKKRIHFTLISFATLVLAYVSSQLNPIGNIPFFGFLANFLIIIGVSFLIPAMIKIVVRVLRSSQLIRHKITLILGGENLIRNLGRSSLTISTSMISIALIINIFTLIESYHYSINKWFQQVNNADFSILSGSEYSEGDIFPMSEQRIDSIRHLPLIKDIDYYRFYTTSYKGKLLDIHALKIDVAIKYVNYFFLEGSQEKAFKAMVTDEAILISENIATPFHLNVGDTITLSTKKKQKKFKIAGVVVNYLSTAGIITMDRSVFQKYWSDSFVDIFKIYLKGGNKQVNLFRQQVYNQIEQPDNLVFNSLDEFKEEVLGAIDDTFQTFHALELITVFIAVIGIINALLASILERKREIGILRSIGASNQQVRNIILSEAGLIGLISAISGIVCGLFLSLVTVFIINKQTVGWYLEYQSPIYLIGFASVAALFLSILSAYYPAKKACDIVIREALEYE